MQESMVKGEVLCQHPLAFETTYYLQVWRCTSVAYVSGFPFCITEELSNLRVRPFDGIWF